MSANISAFEVLEPHRFSRFDRLFNIRDQIKQVFPTKSKCLNA